MGRNERYKNNQMKLEMKNKISKMKNIQDHERLDKAQYQ